MWVSEMKTCFRCETEKDSAEFGILKSSVDGLQRQCKPCINLYQANYNMAHPDKKIANAKKYRTTHAQQKAQYAKGYVQTHREQINCINAKYKKAHPEKIREINMRRRARLALNGVFVILDKDFRRLIQQPCFYCGQDSKHIDHLIPISRGGRHSIGNLVSACVECNLSKSNKFLVEWNVGV